MKRFYKTRLLKPLQILASVLIILLIGQITRAETAKAPDRGFGPGKSYAVSDIESIAMQSGNLMLNVPLGSLPAGRGNVSGGINLSYNSKIWNSITFEDLNGQGVGADKTTLLQSTEGNWHYGYKYYFRVDTGSGDCSGQGLHINKIQLVMPDGGTHTLVGSGGVSNDNQYSYIFPDGRGACSGAAVAAGQTVTLFSIDNSFLRMEVTTDSDTDFNNNQWTLYASDGTRVVNRPQTGISQRIYDRNDNYVDVIENATDANYSGHQTAYLQDPMGRKVVIEYNAATDEDWIHSKGFNNTDVVTRVKWKGIEVNKTYMACDCSAPSPMPPNYYRNFPLNQGMRVVDKIYLPSQISGNLFYGFSYNADATSAPDVGWGEINQVGLPSGATSDYEYQFDNVTGSAVDAQGVLGNGVTKKTLTYNKEYDGATTQTSDVWTYVRTGIEPVTFAKMTAPDGGETKEYYTDVLNQTYPIHGELYKTETANGTVVEKSYQSNALDPNTTPGYPNFLDRANRYVKYEFVSISDAAGNPAKTAIKEYTYDKNGNVTEVKEYGFVDYSTVPHNAQGRVYALPSGITPARIAKTEYYNQTPEASQASFTDANIYRFTTAPRIRNAVKAVEMQNGSGTAKSRSEMFYDNYSTTGNLTQSKSWDSTKGIYSNPLTTSNSISTTATYNAYGMPTLTTDAKGNQTQITYGSINGYTDLYPTQTIAAYGTAIQRTSTAQYDFSTGLVTTTTDVDNNVSSATEYDDLGRPTKAAAAVGTASEVWTQTEYDDANRRVIAKADLFTKGDAKKIAAQHFDQLGRVRLSRQIENVLSEDPYNEQHGIKVQTRYLTGNPYSYQLTSNPYRANYSYNAGGEPSMGWTQSKSINTGKHSETETFTGAMLPTAFGGSNTSSTGKVQTDTDAERTLVTDQAGKQRISKSNALGQLTDIWEITASDSATVAVAFPNQTIAAGYQTSYVYDTLNNLTTVNQGTQQQNRTFSYSSLSRLLTAANPESGTIGYQYDNNGNLSQKTDARSIAANYSYDALNRVTQRSYSDTTTPTVAYTYDDTNVAFSKGKLTKVSSSVSTTEYTGFDILGRVLAHKQTTDGQIYTTGYTYNLSGALIEETYPSTRVVKNVLDTDGDLSIVQSRQNGNTGFYNYADSFTYTSAGAVSSMQLGNGKWESTSFNSRLQPTQIALGTVQSGTDKLKLNYSYGGIDNNGNVQSQTITVPTVGVNPGFTAVQSYTYDSVNRLKSATENIGTQTWKQTFLYDRYGNRNFDTTNNNTTTIPTGCSTAQCNPSVSVSNNKFTTGQGYTYDLSGNVITDAQGRTFNYDGENKQKEVRDANNQIVGQYYYDGDGKRVKKVSNTETVIFVYDAQGKLVAEYANQIPVNPQVSYLTADNLGSPRITTDANGNVISRRDFLPFGEEIYSAQRTQGLGYTADNVKQKFTGYIRDDETELNFATARYQNSNLGRFTSPDPAKMTKERVVDPQHWNLYVYARNNPLLMVDLSGEFPWTFYIRSFIQTSTVGGGLYRGDGRGPSLSTDPSQASSRVRVNFTLDYNSGQITNRNVASDPSILYVGPVVKTGTPSATFSDVESFGRSKGVSLSYRGNDPIPGYVTPDLDVHANISISESITKFGNGTLNIAGTFTGDKYPSTEAFIVDQSGKTKVFLGAKFEEGGVSDLVGDNKQDLFKVDFQVKFDKKGNFTAVIQDGKTYTVDAWNKRVQAQF